jgi:hypothetical protein
MIGIHLNLFKGSVYKMALKDYENNTNQCIINNHSEFVKLLKWFLKHGAENYSGDIPMFESMYDILDELYVIYEDYNCISDDEDDCLLINNISELHDYLLDNINEDTLVPSEDEYPVLVSWYKEEGYDRFGDNTVKILDFTSLKEIKSVGEYLTDYTKKLRKENNKYRHYVKSH